MHNEARWIRGGFWAVFGGFSELWVTSTSTALRQQILAFGLVRGYGLKLGIRDAGIIGHAYEKALPRHLSVMLAYYLERGVDPLHQVVVAINFCLLIAVVVRSAPREGFLDRKVSLLVEVKRDGLILAFHDRDPFDLVVIGECAPLIKQGDIWLRKPAAQKLFQSILALSQIFVHVHS